MKWIDCEIAVTRLRAYFEGELAEQEELVMDYHLDRCEACQSKLDALVESEEGLQPTPHEEAQILCWLRADYALDPEQSRKGVEETLAKIRSYRSRLKETQRTL